MSKSLLRGALLVAASIAPSVAFAHPGHEAEAGLALGFVHPLGGLDHLLAMVAVGLLAFQLGGRSLWLTPVAFVSFMVLGGSLGAAGVGLPLVEVMIALSVVTLGALVALRVRWNAALAATIVAAFALFHGQAHGAEMPAQGSAAAYVAGFVMATVLLHGIGIFLGYLVSRISQNRSAWIASGSGAATACAGFAMLLTHI